MNDVLKGKIALVTGASRGIGRAIAVSLAAEGVDIAVHYHIEHQKAEAVATRIREMGQRAFVIQADVGKSEEIAEMVQNVNKQLGGIDILVNNAGVSHKDKLENIREADWDRVMDINLKSAFLATQACLPHMRKQQWGRIVNISSVAAFTGGVTGPVYVASKAGMLGLTRSYAAMLVKEGITANSVAPALVETDMLRGLDVGTDKIPLGRFGTVEEIAELTCSLIKNGYVTGQSIHLNGGWYFT